MPGIVTAVLMDAKTKAPLAKGGWFCLWQNRGDSGVAGFHMGLYSGKVPAVNPSVKNQRFLPAPFNKGALRPVAADNAHGSFLQIVTSLTRPVSLLR